MRTIIIYSNTLRESRHRDVAARCSAQRIEDANEQHMHRRHTAMKALEVDARERVRAT
jgi:hypothetical protein